MRLSPLSPLALLALFACAGAPPPAEHETSKEKNTPAAGDPAAPLAGASDAPAAATPASAEGCTEAATFVYVVDDVGDLHRFDPAGLTFTRIGALACGQGGGEPFSMAVDRSGTAWVDYTDGSLYRVSTTDASCTKSTFAGPSGFATFGMGFTTNAGTGAGSAESLFVLGCSVTLGGGQGFGLARLDATSFALSPVGIFAGAEEQGRCGELTGTGDGRLYGLFEGNPSVLTKIDPATSAPTLVKTLTGVDTSTDSAYAFSFWGGDFWFYTAMFGVNSKVTRYRAATDDSVSTVIADVGFRIVGAGVSTCAPTSPVK